MAYASRLYPRAEPRGFTLQVIKNSPTMRAILTDLQLMRRVDLKSFNLCEASE